MNLPKEDFLYGNWDLSELGLGSHYGHLILNETPFKLRVFVDLKDNLSYKSIFNITGKSIKGIRGITNNKYVYIFDPYIRNSKHSFGENALLEFIISDLLIGLHLDSPDESFIDLIDISLPMLREWNNENIIQTSINEDSIDLSFSFKPHIIGSYEVNEQIATLKNYVNFSESKETRFSKEFGIELVNKDDKKYNILEAKDSIRNILLLTSTLTNKHILPDEISFIWSDENNQKHEVHYYNSHFSEESKKYKTSSKTLFKLNEISDSLDTIFINYGDILKKNSFFFSTLYQLIGIKTIDVYDDFGSLARAIEGVHRANEENEVYLKSTSDRLKKEIKETIKKFVLIPEDKIEESEHEIFKRFFLDKLNKIEEPSLKTRLLYIFKTLEECKLGENILSQRNVDQNNFASKAVKIRNNLTHLDGTSHLNYSNQEIVNYIIDLKLLFHAYLLYKLGINLSKYSSTLKEGLHI